VRVDSNKGKLTVMETCIANVAPLANIPGPEGQYPIKNAGR